MCAYHNSCGHDVGSGSSSGVGLWGHPSPEVAVQPHLQQKSTHQRLCSHASEISKSHEDSGRMELARGGSCEEEFDDENNGDDDSDNGEDKEEDEIVDREDRCHNPHKSLQKKLRKAPCSLSLGLMQQLSSELTRLMGDGNKSPLEKRHWMKLKLLQLKEQQVSYQLQGFELEKQRIKWVKFSSKKERDMGRSKLENNRRRLEYDRMMLLVRQKEFELVDIQKQQQLSSNRKNNPSSVTN